jgi:TolB-like protein
MFVELVAVAVLSVTPKLAAPGLRCADFSVNACEAFNDHLNQGLTERGVSVVSAADISSVLGHERQKALLGCAEDSCTAEIAAALGVDGLVVGSVAKVGNSILINVRVVSAKNSESLAQFSRSEKSVDAVASALEDAARVLAERLTGQGRRGPSRTLALVPGGVAVAAGIGAGIAFAVSLDAARQLGAMNAPADVDPNALAATGRTAQTTGWILTGVAGAGAVAAVVLLIAGSPSSDAPSVSFAPNAEGGSFVVQGRFP